MILVFDLDDTLYPEITFVQSGFRAVASHLAKGDAVERRRIYSLLLSTLAREGRGAVFDAVLRNLHCCSAAAVSKCLSVYRGHVPKITLYRDAVLCLERFRSLPLYVVTDGNAPVQERKIKALKLHRWAKKTFVSRRYGLANEKPSPYCFLRICEAENARPRDIVYIGDNPRKDFVGLKPLGFKTVRVLRGAHKDLIVASKFDAAVKIRNLNELTYSLLERL